VTPDIAEGLDVVRPTGALVQGVLPGSPAAKAGLRAGDLIVAVAGQEVDDPDAFGFRFATRPLGGTVDVAIVRQGKPATLRVGLEAAPETVPRDEIVLSGRSPLSGATVVNLSPAVMEEMRTMGATKGVVITAVEEGSPAQRTSFKPGDVILDINGTPVATTADLQRITRTPSRAWRVTLQRGGRVISALLPG